MNITGNLESRKMRGNTHNPLQLRLACHPVVSPPGIIFPSSCFPAVLSPSVHLFGKAVYWCRSETMKRFLTSASAILSPWDLCMLLEYMDLTSDNREMIKTVQRPCPVLRSVMSDSCDPMDYSPAGSSVPGILQARILEWVAMPSSRASSWSRDWTRISYVSCTGRRLLHH